jgi:hypothetical protein
MSNTSAPRLPIHAGDSDEVFEAEARLLMQYATLIERDAVDIVGRYSDPDFAKAAARGYASKIAWNVPDSTIKAAIERLAISKFRQAGVAI